MPAKVLVVDDSFMMRILMRKIVEKGGYEVVGEAENGQVALDLVKEKKPDVVLLDIEMPVMDGVEFMKRNRLISRAKVIVVSSVTQLGSPQTRKLLSLGAVEIIEKPSGAMSLDLDTVKGSAICRAIKKASIRVR